MVTNDGESSAPRPRAEAAAEAVVAPVPPSPMANVPVIEEAPRSTASLLDSITKPPFDFASMDNV